MHGNKLILIIQMPTIYIKLMEYTGLSPSLLQLDIDASLSTTYHGYKQTLHLSLLDAKTFFNMLIYV